MLSRVAERTYWIGRYLERAENLARMYHVFGKLLLDLPGSARLGWIEIVGITGVDGQLQDRAGPIAEHQVIEYLIADADNPGSLLSCLALARENARTTREILPSEVWLTINRLYLNLRAQAPALATPAGRHAALTELIGGSQRFTGLMEGTMNHGEAYQFARAGSIAERADMTTRMLDAAIALLLSNRSELQAYDNTLWMAVLRSVSGYQMYRQSVRRRVTGRDVIRFLFSDPEFPRSIQFCIDELALILERLPRNRRVLEAVGVLAGRVREQAYESMTRAELHEFIDRLQRDIGGLHVVIAGNWFQPDNHDRASEPRNRSA